MAMKEGRARDALLAFFLPLTRQTCAEGFPGLAGADPVRAFLREIEGAVGSGVSRN
jgi:hypothetical protein